MPSKTEKPNANFDVSANLLKKLAETMGNAGLSEIEYVDGERSLRLSRATQAPVVAAAPAAAPMMAPMGTDGGTDRRGGAYRSARRCPGRGRARQQCEDH